MTFSILKKNRDAFGEVLVELGSKYPTLVVLDSDLSSSTRTKKFSEVYPERFVNVGIAEQNMVGIAAGLACCSKMPFISSFASFVPSKCVDQLKVLVAYPRLNVKIVVTHSGLATGEDGVTHQAIEDIAIMRAMPNMTVIVPFDAFETKKAIHAICNSHGPFYVRLCRPDIPVIYNDKLEFQIGKGNILAEGSDLSIISCGIMVGEALIAGKKLAEHGIEATIIDMHTIKPIDKEMIIMTAKNTGAVITVEDHNVIGGLGSAVTEVLSEHYPTRVKRIGINDCYGESGPYKDLMKKYGLSSQNIVDTAKEMVT